MSLELADELDAGFERALALDDERDKRLGLCWCGCGQRTALASQTDTKRGYVKGAPVRYVLGHGGHEKLRKPLATLYVAEDRGYETPCWIWQGGTTQDGRYGRTQWNGRMQPAHRAFYERAGGHIPDGMEPDHLCSVTLCVNPEHIEPVTPTENKRRSRSTKLTVEAVAEIRAVHARALAEAPPLRDGKPRQRVPGGVALREQLGQRYGVSPDMIKHVWRGTSWR